MVLETEEPTFEPSKWHTILEGVPTTTSGLSDRVVLQRERERECERERERERERV